MNKLLHTFSLALALALGLATAAPAEEAVLSPYADLVPTTDDGHHGLGFNSRYAEVNGVKLHYVEGGAGGRTIVLIPGWPQTWYVWRKIMPTLARDYRVIAVDTRGMGGSSRPDSGYDTQTAADDISLLMDKLGVTKYSVIGHDIGMWIAYPLASQQGNKIDKLVVTEALIPGVSPTPPMLLPPDANAGLTQFMFNQLRDLPEFLVAGRESEYMRYVVSKMAFRPDAVAVDEYIRNYTVPGAMKAGFEYYRAIPTTVEQNKLFMQKKLTMPVLAIGGDHGAGQISVDTMKVVSDDVQGALIKDCGHYTPEECPVEFMRLVGPFLKK